MPGPWRLFPHLDMRQRMRSFNLNRDARPLATPGLLALVLRALCFNLNRDARPLATSSQMITLGSGSRFNLNRDARHLATLEKPGKYMLVERVSISTNM